LRRFVGRLYKHAEATMHERLIADGRVRPAIYALFFASAICTAMQVARTFFAGRAFLEGLIWNLGLAWLPLIFALRFYRLHGAPRPQWLWLGLYVISWFFFFPNAPYIVTDLIHLRTRPPVPLWFDVVMLMAFAWTGLLLGYLSLFLMQAVVRRRRGGAWSWTFAVGMLAVGSFGIYLGRFARWNSWDVLARPFGLAGDVVRRLDFINQPQMAGFCVTFFAFSLLSYVTLFALIQLHAPEPPPPAPGS
jgi:uncharacterized membrane protein